MLTFRSRTTVSGKERPVWQRDLFDDMPDPQDPRVTSDVLAQPGGATGSSSDVIRTPDQRVRVFVSSTLDELGPERAAAQAAIRHLRLIPVLFELGARPHPPRDLYSAYLAQSAVFVGVYWQRYGWVVPEMTISGLEDEYLLAQGKPKLIYIKSPAPLRDSRLQNLLDRIRDENVACYRRFATAEELQELIQDDLAVLLTERFEQAQLRPEVEVSARVARDLPAGTVTFLCAEIAESTSLLQLGAERYAAIYEEHRKLARQAFAAHGGCEADASGDGFLVVFMRASDAVTAAVETQQALADHPWPDGWIPRTRMGLHSGTARVVDNQYVGLDVRRAALITAAGHGGQILMSDATRALVEHELPVGASLRDLGLHQLKDLQQPEHLYQLTLPQLAADFPPLNTLNTPTAPIPHTHNLPVRSTPLLGREREVAALCALLRQDDIRLVTLTGPGGVGKTWLAAQVAEELVDVFADGVWFVGLALLTDPALVAATIARALGIQETGSAPIGDVLRQQLKPQRRLLLLDNFEQVAAAALEVANLLADCPRLSVLATSRLALRVQGEREMPVGPLALPSAWRSRGQRITAERVRESPAVALFVARAQAHRPDFQLTEANALAVAAICDRLDGLPLAIDLAASRVKLLPPAQLLARLERRLPLLTEGRRDLEARQQTMRNAIAWSEQLLSVEEQRLFRRLAVFAGGFTLEAAEVVCAQPPGGDPLGIDVLRGLEMLVDHSLVQPWTVNSDGQPDEAEACVEARFRWLQVIREYAQEQLEASDDATLLHAAHAAHYLALAERAESELHGAGQQTEEWLRQVGCEYDNVRAALGWLRDRREVTGGLRLAVGIGDYWIAHSHFSEGRRWLEGLLAEAPQGGDVDAESDTPAGVQAQARALLGTLAALLGDHATAASQLETALTLGRALGDQRTITYALGSLADLARVQGKAERAAAHYDELATIAREMGGSAAVAQALAGEGLAAYERGEWARAAVLLEQALAIHRARRELDSMGLCLWLLGVVALHQANPIGATERLREAVSVAQTLGNQDGLAYVLESLAWAAALVGRRERAARLLGAAAAQREALGQTRWPHFREEVEAEVAAARAALGEAAWAAAFTAGRALTLEEVLAEALGEVVKDD